MTATAAEVFAADVAAGRLPSIRAIRSRLRVGQPRAQQVRAGWLAARHKAAQQGTPLRLRLRVRPPELAALPWEFLYDSGRDDHLCLSTPLVRDLDVPEPRRPLTVTPPLQILAMAAPPPRPRPAEHEHEQRRLTEALLPLERSGRVRLDWVGGQTWWDLQDALDRGSCALPADPRHAK